MFYVNSAPDRSRGQIKGEMPRQPQRKSCFRNGSHCNACTTVGVVTEPTVSHCVLALDQAPVECVTHINAFKLPTALWNRLEHSHCINEDTEAQRRQVTCSGSTDRTWTQQAGPGADSGRAALCRLSETLPECSQLGATCGSKCFLHINLFSPHENPLPSLHS